MKRRCALLPGLTSPKVRTHNWRNQWPALITLANAKLEDEPIPPGTPLHALRHSRISHLLLAGVSPQVVVQITGTSLAMLRRHYAHLMVASIEAELERARSHPALAKLDGWMKI